MNIKKYATIVGLILILILVVSILTGATTEKYEPINIEETIVETEAVVETEPETIIIETIEPATANKFAKCQVNLRATPSMIEEPVGILPRGTGVAIFSGGEPGWYKIEYLSNEYYVWSEYLVDAETWAELSAVPFSDQLPLSEDLQKYLWNECQDTGTDYCFALAIMDVETGGTFNPNIISKTNDYGLFQCNGCWKSTFKKLGLIQNDMKDLLNPYNSIHAGLYLLSQYQAEYGVSEAAAFKYNRGHASANSSSAYSRKAMSNYAKWKSIIYPN